MSKPKHKTTDFPRQPIAEALRRSLRVSNPAVVETNRWAVHCRRFQAGWVLQITDKHQWRDDGLGKSTKISSVTGDSDA